MSSPDLPSVVARLRAAGCVFAEEEASLLVSAAATPAALAALVDRRVAGEPLEHLVGWAEFAGRRIAVEAGVFVPRQRTVFLARRAIALAPPRPTVLELCCGSGALGAVVAAATDPARLVAADIDPVAVRCARRNLAPWTSEVHESDLFTTVPDDLRGRVDLLLANVPYVPTEALALMPPEARLHEPVHALDGGRDGFAVLRRLVRDTPDWLAPAGVLLVETSAAQADAAARLMRVGGLAPEVYRDEDLDATVIAATLGTRSRHRSRR